MPARMRTVGETGQFNTDRAYNTGVDQWRTGLAHQMMQEAAAKAAQDAAMKQQYDEWWKGLIVGGIGDLAGAIGGAAVGAAIKPTGTMNDPAKLAEMMKKLYGTPAGAVGTG